ncbi:hypothetical protein IFR04_013959 [Cadophora malorum]|uniref:Uncharacterized protein n=1 Tax=Cadophora malorum TaxID=108018 RepID=A0A8H7VZZ7_9HELO|nr:hypothetical protein IFR04_013959 [Cadophora malorum]
MDRNGSERDYDPLWFEKTIIPLFYKCTLILGLILPILYLLISLLGVSVDINFKGRNWILGFIAFLTAIIDLCSFTQPFNLARPVYVCFYPIRGETFHHPEGTHLRIHWLCFLSAALAAGGAAGWDVFVLFKQWLMELKREGRRWYGEVAGREGGRREWWIFPGRGYVEDMFGESGNEEDENWNGENINLGEREDDEGEEMGSKAKTSIAANEGLSLLGVGSEEVCPIVDDCGSLHSSNGSDTPLLTTNEDPGIAETTQGFVTTVKGEADREEISKTVAVGDPSPRNWLWRLIEQEIKRLSKDRLMGLAWLMTVAAWLVMYGRSKKGKFWGMEYA